MRFTIDRFEGDFAVVELENKNMVDIPKLLLPEDAKEGDILVIIKDEDKTRERRERIDKKFEGLFKEK